MIQGLQNSSLNFKANDSICARDAYSAQIDKNMQIAQKQNNIVDAASQTKKQIPMQGTAQKLDVMA